MCILLWYKTSNRKILIGGSSFVLMSLIIQSMKRIFFTDCLRPLAMISANTVLHVPGGIALHEELSFPSGHAGTIFTAACFLHLVVDNKKATYSILSILFATLVAYSRLYLCQHFYTDIYVGAVIGIGATLLVYMVFINWKGPTWLDQSIRDCVKEV